MLNLILLGPPGAGKGTQAKEIAWTYKIPHISTGYILRQNISNKTTLGNQAKAYIEKGLLVPDNLVLEILFDRLKSEDCKEGYILDGFPRNLPQAKKLNDYMLGNHEQISLVMVIGVQPESIIERISGRLICEKCETIYHTTTSPPSKGDICDKCGGALYQRNDDKKETVWNRLKVYDRETAPLIDYYDKLNLCTKIDGKQDIEFVYKDICNRIDDI